jgi:Glycosyl transferase family 2
MSLARRERILAICLVKDEIDIIEQCLRAARAWADRIFVYDNGSTDRTWEAVLALAETDEGVVPFRRAAKPFRDGLRSEVFHSHRAPDAWWCILDADEFYIDHPRSFLGELDPRHDSVWSSSYEYCFTDVDAARYRENPSRYADDVPVDEKIRFYANTWSELRFFKDRKELSWPPEAGEPYPLRLPAPRRIRLKHFQFRSPEQIQKRIEARAPLAESGVAFLHETRDNWRGYSPRAHELWAAGDDPRSRPQSWEERVVDSSKLHFDAHDGTYVSDEASLPPITPNATEREAGLIRRFAVKARRLLPT